MNARTALFGSGNWFQYSIEIVASKMGEATACLG